MYINLYTEIHKSRDLTYATYQEYAKNLIEIYQYIK